MGSGVQWASQDSEGQGGWRLRQGQWLREAVVISRVFAAVGGASAGSVLSPWGVGSLRVCEDSAGAVRSSRGVWVFCRSCGVSAGCGLSVVKVPCGWVVWTRAQESVVA